MALEARQLGGRYLVAVLESADCACTGVSVQGMVGSGTGEVCVCVCESRIFPFANLRYF